VGVVLTFDDGPDPAHTPTVLDTLDAHDAKATFFVIGHKAEKHPALVREILARGHAVGVHGFAHDRFFALRGSKRVRTDLERAIRVLEIITERTPTLFRPPIGHTNPTIARIADLLELTTVGWSVRARDGLARTKPADVLARITRGLEDGAIILLHDAPERGPRRPAGVTALPQILDAIAARNLRVVPLAAWLSER
jgi:peptidoglycan/xylan/chitin deacetylase (PgdA/CDA1 family)